MLKVLNYLFHAIHVGLILFVLGGWAFEPVRMPHLVICGMVLISWFGIGLVIGKPGYCLITDIQYQIRSRLGLQEKPQSYMVYLIKTISGRTVDEVRMEFVTQAGLYIPTLISTVLLVVSWYQPS